MPTFLDFEKPIAELEGKIEELRHLDGNGGVNIADEVSKLQTKADKLLRQTYAKLTPWQRVQVARHPDRPHFLDYIDVLIENFTPLAGDRFFAEDNAIIGGLGRFCGYSAMVIGHEKGKDIESRLYHNFGMARPEGYRKARRLMKLAERFGLPIITLVDTAGAYPGVGAEERGQAEAIARSIEACLDVRVPLISVIIGEGGSGGAIALAAAELWRLRTGSRQRVTVDMRHAATEFHSESYLRVDDGPPPPLWDKIAGVYRSGDGRWVRIHTNFPRHRQGLLALLGCDYDRDAVSAALLDWEAETLETAATEAGLLVAMMRSRGEWESHPQAPAVAALPLLSIGEDRRRAAPVPVPR